MVSRPVSPSVKILVIGTWLLLCESFDVRGVPVERSTGTPRTSSEGGNVCAVTRWGWGRALLWNAIPHIGFLLTGAVRSRTIGGMQRRDVRLGIDRRLTTRLAIDLLRCASARCPHAL